MSWDERIAYWINVVFGAALGFAIYLYGLGGFRFLLMSRPAHWWNGWLALLACIGVGGWAGAYSYKHRHKEIELPREGIYEGHAGGELLWRRLAVIVIGVVAIYFIWQLAKGV